MQRTIEVKLLIMGRTVCQMRTTMIGPSLVPDFVAGSDRPRRLAALGLVTMIAAPVDIGEMMPIACVASTHETLVAVR